MLLSRTSKKKNRNSEGEGGGGSRLWNSEGMGGNAFWNFRRQGGGVKTWKPSVVGYGHFLELPNVWHGFSFPTPFLKHKNDGPPPPVLYDHSLCFFDAQRKLTA